MLRLRCGDGRQRAELARTITYPTGTCPTGEQSQMRRRHVSGCARGATVRISNVTRIQPEESSRSVAWILSRADSAGSRLLERSITRVRLNEGLIDCGHDTVNSRAVE